jgi:drug/metabolite transporter (DMT)-like permease
VSLLIVAVILALGGRGERGFAQLRTSIPGFHLGRNVVHYVGQYSWFYVLPLLPLVQITAIDFSMPIWALLLAAAFLGERLTGRRIVAVLLGFCGVLVVLRPGVDSFEPAALIVLGASFCYAATFIITKRMTATETPLAILFYMFLVQLLIGLAPALPGLVVPELDRWPWVIAVGVSGLAAHYCVTRAFIVAEASVVIPVDFLRLPAVGVAAWLLYGESGEIWHVAGAGLIVLGIWINIRSR